MATDVATVALTPAEAAQARPRARSWAGWWLPLAVLAPSLAWIALDRSVWPWDQAWFAAHTVVLFEALRDDPLRWPAALALTTPLKPPAVAWIGQLFVPLGLALRSVDAGLLLSVWATHLAALVLLMRALLILGRGRVLVAAGGTLAAGAAPMFTFLSTQYMAEAAQTLAVAWFVLIMASAPRWSRPRLAAHLLGAAAFAMLAKTTSPIYCAAPAMLAAWELVRRRRAAAAEVRDRGAWRWCAAAAVLATAAVFWYWVNWASVRHHALTAAFGPVAELYGGRASFTATLDYRLRMAARVWSLPPTGSVVAAVLALGGIARFVRARAALPELDRGAGAALAQVFMALAVMALSPNHDPRYAAPLLPLVGVVVAWALAFAGGPGRLAALSALTVQFVLVHAQVLGWRPPSPALAAPLDARLAVAHRDDGAAATLAAIVARTCGRGGFGSANVIGVDLLRLNGHSASYAAAKERLAGRAGRCQYVSMAYLPPAAVRHALAANDYVYWIGVDARVFPTSPGDETVNHGAPVVFRELRRSGVLRAEPWAGPPGLRLFRFTER